MPTTNAIIGSVILSAVASTGSVVVTVTQLASGTDSNNNTVAKTAIQYSSNNGVNWTTFLDQTLISLTPTPNITVTGLVVGTAYIFRACGLTNTNNVVANTASVNSSAIAIIATPTKPIVSTSTGSISISRATSLPGASLYIIQRSTASDFSLLDAADVTPITNLYIDNGRIMPFGQKGTTYYYRYAGVTSSGVIGTFSPISDGAQYVTAPVAVVINSAIAGTGVLSDKIVVTWTPLDTLEKQGGLPVLYSIEYSTDNFITAIVNDGITSSPFITTSLIDGTSYSFRIITTNSRGGAISNVKTCSTLAAAPTNVVASESGEPLSVSISFTPPTNNTTITGYNVYDILSSDYSSIIPIATGTSSPIAISGLSADVPYTFYVVSITKNSEGDDQFGGVIASNEITLPAPPPAPSPDPAPAPAPSPAPAPAPAPAICFLGNARVLTPAGYRRIDGLCEGDRVKTADGRVVAIERVFVKNYSPSPSVNPYVIPRGLFGAREEVLISPEHRVAVAGRGLVEARKLGLTQRKMTSPFTYYNLELPNWKKDNLVVGGVEVESLAPVRRMEITKAEFLGFLREKYGRLTPELIARLARNCFFTAGGKVSVPTLENAAKK